VLPPSSGDGKRGVDGFSGFREKTAGWYQFQHIPGLLPLGKIFFPPPELFRRNSLHMASARGNLLFRPFYDNKHKKAIVDVKKHFDREPRDLLGFFSRVCGICRGLPSIRGGHSPE
jgi:hypothetical protein